MARAKKLPSGNWRVLEYSHTDVEIDKDGKEHRIRRYESFTHENKKEAEYMAAEFVRSKKRKHLIKNWTVGEAMDQYIASKSNVLSPVTIREYKRERNHVFNEIISVQLSALTQERVQITINNLSRTQSPKSVRNYHGFLAAVLKRYAPSLILNTTLPQKEKKSVHIPSEKEMSAIFEVVKDTEMEAPIMFAALAGLRRGEIVPLKYGDIDFKNKTVSVTKAVTLDEHNTWQLKQPKSFSGYRQVDLPEVLIAAIKKRQENELPLIDVSASAISNGFEHVLNHAGIENRFRFHDLRHYYASVLLALGIPDLYAMELMGHKTTHMLKTVYQHTMDEKKKEIRASITDHFDKMQHGMQHES